MAGNKLTYRDKVKRFALRMTGNRCAYCGSKFERGEVIHLDHVVPLHGDGSKIRKNYHGLENFLIVPACVHCNLTKSNLTLDQFREKRRKQEGKPSLIFLIDILDIRPVTHEAINDPEVISYGTR